MQLRYTMLGFFIGLVSLVLGSASCMFLGSIAESILSESSRLTDDLLLWRGNRGEFVYFDEPFQSIPKHDAPQSTILAVYRAGEEYLICWQDGCSWPTCFEHVNAVRSATGLSSEAAEAWIEFETAHASLVYGNDILALYGEDGNS